MARKEAVRTKRPAMIPGRAILLRACEAYRALDSRLTLLEVQKLAYFLYVRGPSRAGHENGSSRQLPTGPGRCGPDRDRFQESRLHRIPGHGESGLEPRIDPLQEGQVPCPRAPGHRPQLERGCERCPFSSAAIARSEQRPRARAAAGERTGPAGRATANLAAATRRGRTPGARPTSR